MFREMRRSRQQLSPAEAEEILLNNTSGTLAVSGDDGYPYAVPVSYVYHNGKIYIHCALTGHKLDAIARNDKVSFCVIGSDDVLPEKLTTCYKSVIVFGRARLADDPAEIQDAIFTLSRKYAPVLPEAHIRAEFERERKGLNVLVIDIEHMTGKEAKELMLRRTNAK